MNIQSSKTWGGKRPGAGAPIGNKNGFKHGRYSRELKAERKEFNRLLQKYRKTIQTVNMS